MVKASKPADQSPLVKCWSFPVAELITNPVSSDSNNVFVSSGAGNIRAVDAKLADQLWSSELGGEIVSNILVSESAIYVVTNALTDQTSKAEFSTLRSLSKETGVTNWTSKIPFADQVFLGSGQNSVVAVGLEGSITAVEIHKGTAIWKMAFSGRITAKPYFSDSAVLFGTDAKRLTMIATGKEVLGADQSFVPTAVSIPSDHSVLVGDERGNVSLLNSESGALIWKFKSGGGVSFMVLSKEGLVVASNDNFVYSIWMYNGDVLWKRRMPGRVVDGLLLTEDSVFALVYGENSAFLMNQKNGKVIDQKMLAEKNYISQTPRLSGSNIVFAVSDGIESYALKTCPQK